MQVYSSSLQQTPQHLFLSASNFGIYSGFQLVVKLECCLATIVTCIRFHILVNIRLTEGIRKEVESRLLAADEVVADANSPG